MKKLGLLFVLLVNAAGVYSATLTGEAISNIQLILNSQSRVEGEFTQARYIAALDRELVSSGTFALDVHNGLVWITLKPVSSTLRLSSDMTEIDGRVMSDRGIGKLIFLLLKSAVSGELSKLLNKFKIYSAEVTEGQWSVVIKPRSHLVGLAIAKIRLAGSEFVEVVDIFEEAGNRTHILFRPAL